MEEVLNELKEIKELLKTNTNDELLTAEQVRDEFKIGINMVRKMFNDPKLPVQKYTIPFKVSRHALNKYMTERHDYLCKE